MTSGKKLQAGEVGQNVERSCTNLCCLAFFIVAWMLLVVVAIFSFTRGDLSRLVYGVDYEGNVCSRGSPDLVFPPNPVANGVEGSGVGWSERKYLWYPVSYTASTGFTVNDARQLGVCVSKCPMVGQDLIVYKDQDSNSTIESYFVPFNSSVVLHRCVPDFLSYDCSSTGSTASEATCNSVKDKASFAGASLGGGIERAYEELVASWWILFIAFVFSVVLCLVWLFALRRLVIPIVVVSLLLVLVAIVVIGFLFYRQYTLVDESEQDIRRAFLAAAIITWVCGIVFVALIIFFRKDVLVACQIIEEAVKVPFAIPSTTAVPVVVSLLIIPVAIFCLFTAASTYTAAKTVTATVPIPHYQGSLANSTITSHQYALDNWRTAANIYTLFMFLWALGFIHAIGFMIIAFCGVFWYWSGLGDDKKPEVGAAHGAKLALRYHLGTLACGSLIIAIIQLIRILMTFYEKQINRLAGNNAGFKMVRCCCQCLLACFERFIRFINANAYIVCAMTGEGFKDSALHALGLLGRNIFAVGAVSLVSAYVMTMGKVLITSLVCIASYYIQQAYYNNVPDASGSNSILIIVLIAVVTYMITSIFVSVVDVCIKVVLLSYCYDLEINDGESRPYFMPTDLAKYLDEAKEKSRASEKSPAVTEPMVESSA